MGAQQKVEVLEARLCPLQELKAMGVALHFDLHVPAALGLKVLGFLKSKGLGF